MTFQSEFTDRFPPDLVIGLTNFGDSTATTVNTTKLTKAENDAKSEFKKHTGVVADETDNDHIDVVVLGMFWKLHQYTGAKKQAAKDAKEDFVEAAISFSTSLGAESRILPSSSSVRQQSDRTPGSLISQDNRRWNDFVPKAPLGAEDDEETFRNG